MKWVRTFQTKIPIEEREGRMVFTKRRGALTSDVKTRGLLCVVASIIPSHSLIKTRITLCSAMRDSSPVVLNSL